MARGSVLVVDDDDFTRMALAAVLTSRDYEMAGQAETTKSSSRISIPRMPAKSSDCQDRRTLLWGKHLQGDEQ